MIAHVDVDAFFAAVELHRHPELRGKPLVVGGDPNGRGVVATANYAAREFGIRSAMSAAEAKRRCPDAAFIRPEMATYRAWSERLWALVEQSCEIFEQVGLDEAYVQLDEANPVDHAHRIRQLVRTEMRLSCSIGVSRRKIVAKVASDFDKPGGLTVVAPGTEAEFLAPMKLRALPGVGPATERRLVAAGLSTLGDLAALEDGDALAHGKWGAALVRRARGIDPRTVGSERTERISMSTERTFTQDISDRAKIRARCGEMAERIGAGLKQTGRNARTVTVKLRYGDFTTITRAATLRAATDDPAVIGHQAMALISAALEQRGDPIRLLGVGATGLTEEQQLTLFAHREYVAG